MFKKTRIKIVAVMLSVLIVLFAGTLGIIYFFSYTEMSASNQEMLSIYAQAYWENGNPSGTVELPPLQTDYDLRGARAYRLRSFHSVAFSEEGEVVTYDNNVGMGISDEELFSLAERILEKKKSDGVLGSWVYHVESEEGVTLVVLMDNIIISENIRTLLRYTVLFGSITLVLLSVVSFFIARGIVRPLEESYQKQKQFISDAGHELKTPIAVVSTNVELLERELGENRWLDNVKFETSRMADLVRQLLELARTESAEPEMSRLDLGRLVTGGVLPFESVAFEKNRLLQTDICGEVYVLGNSKQLGNLVSILVDNALDYAPEGSVVFVSLRPSRGRALLSVSNEGAAIPEEQRKNLFERFYRGDSARGGQTQHYGLGLAIAKAIAGSHHGKIEVTCRQNRVTFTVSIPLNF